jgi:hypothetical protein
VLFAYEEIGRNLKKQALILITIVSAMVYLVVEYRYPAQSDNTVWQNK